MKVFLLLQEDVQLLVYRKRARLSKAFELLMQWHPGIENYVITDDTWQRLMKFMDRRMDNLQTKVYFVVLTDGEHYISKLNLYETRRPAISDGLFPHWG